MTASQVDKGAKDAVLSQYLKNGLPSVLLAVIATAVAVYSHWFVSPMIQVRYEKICERNFERLNLSSNEYENILNGVTTAIQNEALKTGLDPSTSNGSLLTDSGKLEVDGIADSKSLSDEELLELFEQTQLCLRRLTISQPDDEAPVIRAAILAQAFADWYRYRAWDLSESEVHSEQVADFLSRERYQLSKATEAMRSVERLDGSLAAVARAWIIERQRREASLTGGGELDELASSAMKTRESKGENRSLTLVLAKILVMEALEPATSIADAVRLQKLNEATRLLNAIGSDQFEDLSWLALAQLPFDRQKSQENSWDSVQRFWTKSGSTRLRAIELDSVLRSMLVGGVFEEAESFVQNQLKSLPVFEKADLRVLASASCVRQVIASLLTQSVERKGTEEEHQTQEGMLDHARLLDFAVKMRADPNLIVNFLIYIAGPDVGIENGDKVNSQSPATSLHSQAVRLLDDPKIEGLKQILIAIIGSSGPKVDESKVREAIEKACRNDIAYSILAMHVSLSLVGNGTSLPSSDSPLKSIHNNWMSRETAMVWLRTINEISPDLLDAWLARGNLHLSKGEKSEAAKCFTYLHNRLPDNALIAEKLKESQGM